MVAVESERARRTAFDYYGAVFTQLAQGLRIEDHQHAVLEAVVEKEDKPIQLPSCFDQAVRSFITGTTISRICAEENRVTIYSRMTDSPSERPFELVVDLNPEASEHLISPRALGEGNVYLNGLSGQAVMDFLIYMPRLDLKNTTLQPSIHTTLHKIIDPPSSSLVK